MKKIYLIPIVIFSAFLLILFVLYNRYAGYYEDEKINSYISKNIEILNENIEFEKRYALSISLFLSKNNKIKEALHKEDQAEALREIKNFLNELKKATGINNIDIQIHTKELKAFARSWENGGYLGKELSGFRKGLVLVKNSKKPFVSIELGKRLNIKAISPILDKEHNFIGSIEAIVGFQNIKHRLRKFDLDILGLLDSKFIDIAVDIRDHKRIGGYYVVENEYPKTLFDTLKKHLEIFKKQRPYYKIDGRIITTIPMRNVGIEDVGMIVLSMREGGSINILDVTNKKIERENQNYTFDRKYRKVIIK